MKPYLGAIIVWLIVGGWAGTLAGRLVTFKKQGLGRWTNIGVGLIGALIGGGIFKVFNINLGLGDLKFTFEDLIAAFSGSLVFLAIWWLTRLFVAKKKPDSGTVPIFAGTAAKPWSSKMGLSPSTPGSPL